MPARRIFSIFIFALCLAALSLAGQARAADSDDSAAAELKEIRKEMRQMREERKRDRELIQSLEIKVQQLEVRDSKVAATTQQLQNTDQKLQQTTVQLQQTNAELKTLQARVETPMTPSDFGDAFSRYLGTHSFTIAGAAGGNFIYDDQNAALDGLHHASQNSFFFDWEPMFLYRPTDWILFEGVISTAFGSTGTGADLSTADFQLFLCDYLTVVGGLFDQPFGDWYESQSPMWVNRFVTAPLPFGIEPVVPPAELGVQLRGGAQFGALGQDFDYTVWGGNGPSYSSNVLGAAVSSPTSSANSQTNGKSIGARIRVYPIPLGAEMGRLELGASTYNGKWMNGNWYNSWGVDFNYFIGNLQTRGEWMESYRQMPNGMGADNRQGWYLQAGYLLNDLNVPGLPDKLNGYLHRFEPLVRYSGVNQRAVSTDDILAGTGVGQGGFQVGLVPDFGINGSPATYAPHSREVALALDYWVAPSIVWQNELDFELPRAGGLFVSPETGVATPAGSIPNDRAFLSQFTIGF
jgi:Sec-independent protein translocase protein TatA